MNIKRIVASALAFIVAYLTVDYLIDKKIDIESCFFCLIGYIVGLSIVYIIYKKRNK